MVFFSLFLDISLLSGKKSMNPPNNSWFLEYQFEKSMYTSSQNISFSAHPSVLSWQGGYITMYLKMSII